MRKEPPKPKSSTAGRRDAGEHPVLARFPDVSEHPTATQRDSRAAAAGFVDYRFDMPAGRDDNASSTHQETRPHVFHRHAVDGRPRSYGAASRVLPDSDPFAIPATTLLDRLAPVARFLTVFILVTTTGTFVLSTRREVSYSRPAQPSPASATAPAGIHQSLEPAPSGDHPTIASPTAFGPLGATANAPTNRVARQIPVDSEPQRQNEAAKETADDGDPFEFDPFPVIETATTPTMPTLARADGGALPQVRTTEPVVVTPGIGGGPFDKLRGADAPARSETAEAKEPSRPPMARLPNVIFEAPRNAYHDNHQPGLH